MRRALVGVALLAVGFGLALFAVRRELARSVDLREVAYVGSDACRRCHEDHHASWHRTFHRTMTREATAENVLGAFDGRSFDYLGWRFELSREGDEHRIGAQGPNGERRDWVVDRTVGSHRYQQYLARDGDTWWRLPVAWHREEERFFSMNGAFLTPDPQAPASVEAMERHVTRWNDNCVFCHNVAPSPGLRADGTFDTEVAELGVACEACHGPGAEHVARNANPLRRYWLHYVEDDDPTLVDPNALSAERASDVCGRCHGQRKTSDLGALLADGDPFVPGEDLARHSEPLWIDTTLDGEEIFSARFWEDGTPRLTAYEYQGWLQSPCARDASFGCGSCHSMHESDPAGQLREDARGDRACTTCHSLDASHAAHPIEAEVRCVDCHMPRIVYGVLDAHRSHRIDVPEPARDAALGRPDACTACHADRTTTWADRARARFWPRATTRAGGGDRDLTEDGTPALTRLLLGGDPIARALAADAMGRAASVSRPRARGALLDAMANDPYPAVRRLAFRAWRRLEDAPSPWEAFDPMATSDVRAAACASLRATTVVTPLDPERTRALREHAAQAPLWIGE
ncbi:MAG: hypothetical protein H6724_16935 [Sandaracinus sp.]|nr:hypothetical protein [Sandaracinus sp.]